MENTAERFCVNTIRQTSIISSSISSDNGLYSDLEESLRVFDSSEEPNLKLECDWKTVGTYVKLTCLICIWILCCCALMTNNVKIEQTHQLSIPNEQAEDFFILEPLTNNKIKVTLQGSFLPLYYRNMSKNWLSVWFQLIVLKDVSIKSRTISTPNILLTQNITDVWDVPLVPAKLLDVVPEVTHVKVFHLNSIQVGSFNSTVLGMKLQTDLHKNFPLSMAYDLQPINFDYGIIYAGLVLTGLYVLIIFELVHRTLAAMLASTAAVALLAALNARPTMIEIITWIDVETLLLLFSMMTIVTIFSETGVFDYMSVFAYKVTNGKEWPLINTLCFITAAFSCFLDNVTTTLLITPVTIKLCEVLKLNPIPILIYMLIFANIGGAVTPIGDPPNVIIASNPNVIESGVNFGVFTLHMGLGSFIALFLVYIQLRLCHRDLKHFKYSELSQVQEIKREIAVWQRVAASLSSYSKDEDIVKKTMLRRSSTLLGKLKNTAHAPYKPEQNFKTNLQGLQKMYPIKDKILLIKSGITLAFVIFIFFLHSVPEISILGLGWTAFLGTLCLLILYNSDNIEVILGRVEWSTLLFFASLFILMEALTRLGLIDWIGKQTQIVIMSVNQNLRLTVAIILILWVSAIASAFVDNLPLTTMMIRIATDLSENQELNLPLQPLIWALSFGACLGGNGTLFGSSSNIVSAGVAEQHGYRITFVQFTKVGLPAMLTSMIATTIYLYVCHVCFSWH